MSSSAPLSKTLLKELKPTPIVRDLGYPKWYSAYQYLLSMSHLQETCVSEGSGYKWMLVRKHKSEIDCTVERYNDLSSSTKYYYVQQYYRNGQLLKESVLPIISMSDKNWRDTWW